MLSLEILFSAKNDQLNLDPEDTLLCMRKCLNMPREAHQAPGSSSFSL